jgi:hypothetical protein
MMSVAYRMLGSVGDAEDAVQGGRSVEGMFTEDVEVLSDGGGKASAAGPSSRSCRCASRAGPGPCT